MKIPTKIYGYLLSLLYATIVAYLIYKIVDVITDEPFHAPFWAGMVFEYVRTRLIKLFNTE